MIINLGTASDAKIRTVQGLDGFYDWFRIDTLNPVKVPSGVSEQPMTLEETLQGAKNRARLAYDRSECDLGIGMESGLMPVAGSLTWYVACECAAVYDGKNYFIGTGGGFEYPKSAIDRIVSHGEDLSQAYKSIGLTEEEKIGQTGGIIWHLTDGRVDRAEYNRRILVYALTSFHNKELYL